MAEPVWALGRSRNHFPPETAASPPVTLPLQLHPSAEIAGAQTGCTISKDNLVRIRGRLVPDILSVLIQIMFIALRITLAGIRDVYSRPNCLE